MNQFPEQLSKIFIGYILVQAGAMGLQVLAASNIFSDDGNLYLSVGGMLL